jgi:hypothetical protein
MCGLSFSGKTTLARKIVERLQCAYISLDDINAERGLWGGDGIPVEEWERTHALARERLATSNNPLCCSNCGRVIEVESCGSKNGHYGTNFLSTQIPQTPARSLYGNPA